MNRRFASFVRKGVRYNCIVHLDDICPKKGALVRYYRDQPRATGFFYAKDKRRVKIAKLGEFQRVEAR